jgi:hypothetical protein
MRKLLIFQNDSSLDNDQLIKMRNYIQECIDTGVVVIDNRVTYDTVECDDIIFKSN